MAVCRACQAGLPEGARFCPACGTPADQDPVGDERKVVTVLFADLVGSTSFADDRDPEDVRAVIRPYFARVRAELERYGGTFEKFIGDAVMALFGAPVAHEDDPERAVRAALAIRDALSEAGDLAVRIAVHTGEAVISLGARPVEGEGMAAGDVVNTAFRMQEAAPTNAVVVGETTYRATQAAIEYGERRLIDAKGKAEPVVVWEALRVKGPLSDRDQRGSRAPLVGRREELSLILDTLARAKRDRTPQLVTLVGAPGIGKSRLVWELAGALASETGLVTWRRGRCLPYGDGVTFWALAEIVKEQAQILETDDRGETERKLRRAVRDVIADLDEGDWIEGHLRPLVGLGERGVPAERREEAFSAWRRFFEALAEWAPLVLVFEDVHWADEGLLDFVDHVADWATQSPVLLLCTARPELHERRPSWGARRNAATIALSPLTANETQMLLSFLLRQPEVPPEIEQAVLERAEGNPLYAEEFLRMLVDRGFLRRDARGWELQAAELPLPESVQALIASRVDALASDEKAVVQHAAVVGRAFWVGAVAAMCGRDHGEVEQQLRALEQKELVRRVRQSALAGEVEYCFHHSLVRDVAYAQIPRARRAALHRAAADWLEAVAGDRHDRVELLAHHLWKSHALAKAVGAGDGDLTERARRALVEAGQRALVLNSFAAAANYLGAALELDPGTDPSLLFAYGKSLFHTSEEGEAELLAARDALLAAGDAETAAEAEVLLGHFAFGRGRRDDAFQHLERAAAIVRDAPTSPAKVMVLSTVASFLLTADRAEEAVAVSREALAMAEELGLDTERARALRTIGAARGASGDARGVADLELAIEVSAAVSSPEMVLAQINLAGVYVATGDLNRACQIHADARRAAVRFGNARAQRWLAAERVSEHYWAGRWDDAVGAADAIVANEEGYLAATVRIPRGQILLARGAVAAASEDAEAAVEISRLAKDSQLLFPALAFAARAALAAGREQEALSRAQEVVEAVTGGETLMGYFFTDLAAVFEALEQPDELVGALARVRGVNAWRDAAAAFVAGDAAAAAELYERIGSRPDEAFARLRAAERARGAEAARELELATPFFAAVGASAYLARAEAVPV